MVMFKEKIIIEMKEVFKEIPFGIEHTLKVLKNAEDIMKGENIGEEEKEFISIIAILHDIGAVEAQKKYGSIDGVYQEKEGPEVAKDVYKRQRWMAMAVPAHFLLRPPKEEFLLTKGTGATMFWSAS